MKQTHKIEDLSEYLDRLYNQISSLEWEIKLEGYTEKHQHQIIVIGIEIDNFFFKIRWKEVVKELTPNQKYLLREKIRKIWELLKN